MMRGKARRSNSRGDAGALHHFGNHADNAGDMMLLGVCLFVLLGLLSLIRELFADETVNAPRSPMAIRNREIPSHLSEPAPSGAERLKG